MSKDDKKGPPDGPEPPQDENQIIAERRTKLAAMRERGSAYPNDFRRNALAAELHAMHDAKSNEELESAKVEVSVAGRMLLKRVMGKASFATLQDMSGRIQLYVTNDHTGGDAHDAFKHWDLGDILGATGTLFRATARSSGRASRSRSTSSSRSSCSRARSRTGRAGRTPTRSSRPATRARSTSACSTPRPS